VPTIVIGVPTHHMHFHLGLFGTADLEACTKLIVELAKALDRKTVGSLTAI
jgi:putative aminopeptidase FrvX